jgi:hypothetical protein
VKRPRILRSEPHVTSSGCEPDERHVVHGGDVRYRDYAPKTVTLVSVLRVDLSRRAHLDLNPSLPSRTEVSRCAVTMSLAEVPIS